MQKRIMLTGVPGVGKTTIARHSRVGDLLLRVKTFGEVMTNIGLEQNVISRSDELKNLELPKRRLLQRQAAERIVEDSKTSPVVIDGHLLVDTPAGFVPGLPFDCIALLNLDAIILLQAPANHIIERRQKNESKYRFMREWPNHARIEVHQRLLLEATLNYALVSGASLEWLDNPTGGLDSAVEGFLLILRAVAPTLDTVPEP